MSIVEQGERFCLVLQPLVEGIAYETIDAWNAFLVRLFRQLHDPDLAPLSVSLCRPMPMGFEERYLAAFHAPVAFDAPCCEICLPTSIVDEPLMGGNREIAQQNDAIIRNYLAEMDEADLITRVKQAIIQSLSAGNSNKQHIARELAMSPSALQQKLAERSTGFQNLLNEVRQSLALAYMEQPQLTITEMSFLLGFTDTGSFTRAFRRWTGFAPRVYRRVRKSE